MRDLPLKESDTRCLCRKFADDVIPPKEHQCKIKKMNMPAYASVFNNLRNSRHRRHLVPRLDIHDLHALCGPASRGRTSPAPEACQSAKEAGERPGTLPALTALPVGSISRQEPPISPEFCIAPSP